MIGPRRRAAIAMASSTAAATTIRMPRLAWTRSQNGPALTAQATLCAAPEKYSGGRAPGWFLGIWTKRLTAMPIRNWASSTRRTAIDAARKFREAVIVPTYAGGHAVTTHPARAVRRGQHLPAGPAAPSDRARTPGRRGGRGRSHGARARADGQPRE